MGLLDFNITEVASRLVRGAGVRGRIRPTLDDGIIPVAELMDYSSAPYRLDEQKYFAGIMTPNFVPANGHGIAIQNASQFQVIVEWYRVLNRTGLNGRWQGSLCTNAFFAAHITSGGPVDFRTGENGGPPWSRRADVFMQAYQANAGPIPLGDPHFDTFDIPSNAGGSSWVMSPPGLDLMIPPGMAACIYNGAIGISAGMVAQIRLVKNFQQQP